MYGANTFHMTPMTLLPNHLKMMLHLNDLTYNLHSTLDAFLFAVTHQHSPPNIILYSFKMPIQTLLS